MAGGGCPGQELSRKVKVANRKRLGGEDKKAIWCSAFRRRNDVSKRLPDSHSLRRLHGKPELKRTLEYEDNRGAEVELPKEFSLVRLEPCCRREVEILVAVHVDNDWHRCLIGDVPTRRIDLDPALGGEEVAEVAGLAIGHEIGVLENMNAAHIGGANCDEGKESVQPIAHVDGSFVDAEDAVQPAGHQRTHREETT